MFIANMIIKGFKSAVLFTLTCVALTGCGSLTPAQNILAGVVGVTAYGGSSPSTEIEQIYYLGVFDPQEQVPPTVYRVRVHGQAGSLSATKFASGWVKADLIDSLGTNINLNSSNGMVQKASEDVFSSLKPGRKLMLFGPEGFREAPEGHRLVIVMGSSPEKFFRAIDESLGTISKVQAEMQSSSLSKELFEALTKMENENSRLQSLSKDIKAELPEEPLAVSEKGEK